MRYRMMATYRGSPYEAGVGPADGEVVLFAACPPPEELGFEPATGHWRKELPIRDVQAVWESRPVGRFRGDRCIVLDDLGDRLHIGYLGHDAYRAEQLGYWQVDRGVFELVAVRDEVTEIVEERTDYPYQPGPTPPPAQADAGHSRAGQSHADQAAYQPAPLYSSDYPGGTGYQPEYPAGLSESGRTIPADGGVTLPAPAAGPPLPLEAEALRAAGVLHSAPASPSQPAQTQPAQTQPAQTQPAQTQSAQTQPAQTQPAQTQPAQTQPAQTQPAQTQSAQTQSAQSTPAQALAALAAQGLAALSPAATLTRVAPPAPLATAVPLTPLAQPAAPAADGSPRRRRSASRRMATERIFSELANLAAIPESSYSVGDEVEGAMCLLETPDGFEVFSRAGGARHEVRVFSDEESACFYLFGVLAADAVRTGGLVPRSSSVLLPAPEALLPR